MDNPKENITEEKKTEKQSLEVKNKPSIYIATGRRKEAVASVRLFPGKGDIIVNKRPYTDYFSSETHRIIIKQPLTQVNSVNKFDIIAKVKGGGITGQAGALRLGISRALSMADTSFMSILRRQGFLSRDPRMKERKKYGQKGARKRFQWTKR